MHLRDLKLRAMDGSILVEGELRIVSDEPAAATLPSSKARLIGVSLGQGRGRTSFQVYDQTGRVGDGFYAAGPPILSLILEEGLPDLRGIFLRAAKRRQRVEGENVYLATVSVKQPKEGANLRELVGRIDDLIVGVTPEDDGLRLTFNGAVGPMKFYEEPAPQLSRARLVGDILVPRAYCALQRLSLGWRSADDPRIGPWEAWGPGLGEAPMSVFGTPYCPGILTWGQPADARPLPAGYVALNLNEHRLIAKPVGALDGHASGFASEHHYFSDGPELELGLGTAEWARMLEADDDVELELRGAGIGHVDGQTGRSVGECGGPMRQLISHLALRLRRGSGGLEVQGHGRLLPLSGEAARSLGPDLAFDFLVPRGWILAHGLRVPRYWQDWRKAFPNETVW